MKYKVYFMFRMVVIKVVLVGWFFLMIFLIDILVVKVLFKIKEIVNIKYDIFFFWWFRLLFFVFLNFYSRIDEYKKVFVVLNVKVRVEELL